MKKLAIGLASTVVLVTLAAIAISYSWTFTPQGRLAYKAAILAKLSYWHQGPISLDAESIRVGDVATAELIGMDKPDAGFTQHDVEIAGAGGRIPIRIYVPDGADHAPAMINYHGGGFFAGRDFAFDAVPMEFALRAGVVVFSVDYRLAPRYPFPAAVEDSYRALQWVAENAGKYRADSKRVGLMGQSAGANLAAVVALKARDESGPDIGFQYLEVPVVDHSGTRSWPSMEQAGDNWFLKVSMMPTIANAYLPNPADRANPYASPLLASDLRGLPPALILVAQFDPLRDQGIAYAHALQESGVPVELQIAPGVLHGFIGTPRRALENITLVKAAMQRAFSQRVQQD